MLIQQSRRYPLIVLHFQSLEATLPTMQLSHRVTSPQEMYMVTCGFPVEPQNNFLLLPSHIQYAYQDL